MFRKSKFSKNLTNFTTDSTVRTCLNHPMLADILADASWTFFLRERKKTEHTWRGNEIRWSTGSQRDTRVTKVTAVTTVNTESFKNHTKFFSTKLPLPIAFWTLEARQLKNPASPKGSAWIISPPSWLLDFKPQITFQDEQATESSSLQLAKKSKFGFFETVLLKQWQLGDTKLNWERGWLRFFCGKLCPSEKSRRRDGSEPNRQWSDDSSRAGSETFNLVTLSRKAANQKIGTALLKFVDKGWTLWVGRIAQWISFSLCAPSGPRFDS